MNEKFDESSLNEAAINDVETARLALRWALDKIRVLHEEDLKTRQNLQEKNSQVVFLENQLKTKTADIERAVRSHDEEMKSRQDSLENQFRSRLERLSEREKELEDKISKHEELLKVKEVRLHEDYQKKSEELRGRWAQVEGELWQLRQEQMAKQQEFERVYETRLEGEKKKLAEEGAAVKISLDRTYQNKVEELEKRERSAGEELKKQEAMLKWAKDSWQKDTEERERTLNQKGLEVEKKILEKNQELDTFKVKISLLEKQLSELPEAVRRRDEDLSRYKDAMRSLEGVIGALEDEKKNQQSAYEGRLAKMELAVEAEKTRFREMEAEIPRRLKMAVEHEHNRLAEKLQDIEHNYKEDLAKRHEEIDYLQRNLRTFEDTIKTLQAEREVFVQKAAQAQAQYAAKQEEFSFRERQLQSEYEVRLKVETEKHTRDLRAELDTAGRIYEDSHRLKTEEISHLRREMEELAKERAASRELVGELRRELESAKERHLAETSAIKLKFTAEYEQRVGAETAEALKRQAAEKQKFAEILEEKSLAASSALERKEEELNLLKLALQKSREELKLALAEEKARGCAAIEENAMRSTETLKLREDKIVELARALESGRLEKEELLMLERQRLERLYAEKEKAMDAELAVRDSDVMRARDTLGRAAADKEALVSAFNAERHAFEEKISALSARLADEEASAVVKADAAVRREVARYSEIIERKNNELSVAAQVRQTQEEAYRKTLEEFREKLADTLSRFEVVRKTAEDRQQQVAAAQLDLARERKSAEDSIAHLSARLAGREKDYKNLRTEYDDFKAAFEDEVQTGEKKYEDAMLRLRASEEQKNSRDKQLEALKRDAELLRAELLRHDREAAELKAAAAKTLEAERRELRLANERLAQDFAQKEKTLLSEVSVFRDEASANEIAAEKYRAQAEESIRNVERLRAVLDEERARKTGAVDREEFERRIKEFAVREASLAEQLKAAREGQQK